MITACSETHTNCLCEVFDTLNRICYSGDIFLAASAEFSSWILPLQCTVLQWNYEQCNEFQWNAEKRFVFFLDLCRSKTLNHCYLTFQNFYGPIFSLASWTHLGSCHNAVWQQAKEGNLISFWNRFAAWVFLLHPWVGRWPERQPWTACHTSFP